jgi:hypothetical protein
MTLTQKEIATAYHACETAAQIYRQHALECSTDAAQRFYRLVRQFDQQAKEAEALAEKLQDEL